MTGLMTKTMLLKSQTIVRMSQTKSKWKIKINWTILRQFKSKTKSRENKSRLQEFLSERLRTRAVILEIKPTQTLISTLNLPEMKASRHLTREPPDELKANIQGMNLQCLWPKGCQLKSSWMQITPLLPQLCLENQLKTRKEHSKRKSTCCKKERLGRLFQDRNGVYFWTKCFWNLRETLMAPLISLKFAWWLSGICSKRATTINFSALWLTSLRLSRWQSTTKRKLLTCISQKRSRTPTFKRKFTWNYPGGSILNSKS